MAETLPPPLRGVRVLDLATMIAAPTTAQLLGDYGADVIKIEQPGTGDHVRHFGRKKHGQGLYWKALGRNKRSVALDLHDPEIVALVLRWVATFDILIENFRPGTLEKWGLGPDRLLRANPRLVVLRVTGFGQNGPYRERAGFGTLAEAMSGLASMTGFADRPPVLPAAPLADIMAGYLGASAVLAAMHRARATGEGDVIDLAIYEAVLPLVQVNIVEYDQLGVEPDRRGNRSNNTAPRGAYRCGDGQYLALSASAQPIAMRLLEAIGGTALAHDPRFATNELRMANVEDLDAIIEGWCEQRPRDEAIAVLTALGCAVGPLETIPSLFTNPQIVARASIASVDDPDLGAVRMTGAIPTFERSAAPDLRPGAASVGADSRAILREDLGLDDAQIEALIARGAVQANLPV